MSSFRVLVFLCTVIMLFNSITANTDRSKESLESGQQTCSNACRDDMAKLDRRLGDLEQDRGKLHRVLQRLDAMESQQREMHAQVTSLIASRFAENGTMKRQLAEQTEVAFYAYIGSLVEHLGMDQVIKFDHVVTNIDSTNSVGGYSGTTGVFTAPVDGLYVFHATVMSHLTHVFYAMIYKESTPVATIHLGGGIQYNMASNSAVLALRKGERVMVRHESADHSIEGAYYGGQSTFAGFLLVEHFYPDHGNPVVG